MILFLLILVVILRNEGILSKKYALICYMVIAILIAFTLSINWLI
jgi:hypothetical protein